MFFEPGLDLSAMNRRTFLSRSSVGIGSVALASLLDPRLMAGEASWRSRGLMKSFDVTPRVKRVIYLYMSGGPSQFETFDFKPALAKLDGQPMPESFTKGQPIAQLQGQTLKVLRPLTKFHRHGQSGQQISEFLPAIARHADDLCIIRSMHTDQINHDPAHTVMNTGTAIQGRPSMGSWVTYGLGSESDDLPGFVVMTSDTPNGRSPQPISTRQWHSGFLPGQFQGVEFRAGGDPVHYLNRPPGVTETRQRDVIDAVAGLNRLRDRTAHSPEIEARIRQYELAFRMQSSVPELMDLTGEPAETLDLYGVKAADGSFASNCLLARRLAERGVRFIQLYHRDWDHHGDLERYMTLCAGETDRATSALLTDLKRLGMLDETLVIWGGEFGRTPMFQGKGKDPGRDHHMRAFSMWLAGGGVKGGITYGATDELGYHAVENPVHVHDLQATILHLLGIDHKKLTYRYQGRDFRLT
ncbi:MAG: DUF1501 domain-containing protein, partial [Isosphaeraceae bacterium]